MHGLGQENRLGVTSRNGALCQRQHVSGMERFSTVRCRSLPSRRLGRTDLDVPTLCFGTMLFGESTSSPAACRLLDMCMESGVNFFDSAEMYPVPQAAATQGLSERILGKWMKSRARDKVIVSTKVAGPSGQMTWIRGGPAKVDAANITAAIEGSLQRLGTDYIDLYQIHWPDRYVPMFGDVDYCPSYAYSGAVPLEEQLGALGDAVRMGKVRHIGLSNETSWGLMKSIQAADRDTAAGDLPLPRIASLQNAYSLTCRTFDSHLAECCHAEGVSLLAYSPLAMGLLSGKYQAPGGAPPEARLNKYKGRYAEAESRYGMRPSVLSAVDAYSEVAQRAGMEPCEMALRFVLSHPLVASAVIGATSEQQLHQLLRAAESGVLEDKVMEDINEVHARFPNPTP